MARIVVVAALIIIVAFGSSALAYSWAERANADLINDALALPDGATITLKNVLVDYVLGDYAFVRDTFVTGTRPILPAYMKSYLVDPGWSINVSGRMATGSDGRRVLVATDVSVYMSAWGDKLFPSPPAPFLGDDWPYIEPAETQMTATNEGTLPPIPAPEPIVRMSAPAAGTVAGAKFCNNFTSAPIRVQSPASVSALASMPPQLESGLVELTGRPVTAVYHLSDGSVSFFYAQENIVGGSGIKCVPTVAVPVEPGNLVDIKGSVEVVAGEAQITVSSVTCSGSTARPAPIGLIQRSTARGEFGIQPALYLKTSDASPGSGLSAVGSRVRVFGAVLSSSTENGHAVRWIDDGSGLSTTAHNGLKIIYWNPTDAPTSQTYISLTGILGAEMADDKPIPVVRVPESTPWETPAGVKYVKPNGTGNGSSWTNAYGSVQSAIDAAILETPACEVWVAAGTYNGTVGRITDLKNGVAVYGGFVGTEMLREQRNWVTNVTVLYGQGAYPVVKILSGTTAASKIDGFTLRNGASSDYGGGVCSLGSAIIAHNLICNNSAASNGGGIGCSGGNPIIWDNTVSNNTVSNYNSRVASGGGIMLSSSSATVIGNVISNNTVRYDWYNSSVQVKGGGVACFFGSPKLYGNTITGNTLSASYGVVKGEGIYSDNSSPVLLNNAISGNIGSSAGVYIVGGTPTIANNIIASHGGLGVKFGAEALHLVNNTIVSNATGISLNSPNNSAVITNNIIAFNSTAGISKSGTGNPRVDYNCVYNPNATDYSGLVAGTHDVTGVDANPDFLNLSGGDFHIMLDSPCADAGNDADLQIGWIDIDNETRAQNAHVDIGADEIPGCLARTVTLTMSTMPMPINASVGATVHVHDVNTNLPAAGQQVDISVDAGEILTVTRDGSVITLPSGTQSTYGITDEEGNVETSVTRQDAGYVNASASITQCFGPVNDTKSVQFYDPITTPVNVVFLIDITSSTDARAAAIKSGIRDTVDYLYVQLLTQGRTLQVAGIKFSNNYPNLLDSSLIHSNGVLCDFVLLDSTAACDAFKTWVGENWVGGYTEYQLDILMFAKDLAPSALPGLYIALATDEDSDSVAPLTVTGVAAALSQAGCIVFIDPAHQYDSYAPYRDLPVYYQDLAVNGGAVESESMGTFTFSSMRQSIVGTP